MRYVFRIFRPFKINHACDNFRPHGNMATVSLSLHMSENQGLIICVSLLNVTMCVEVAPTSAVTGMPKHLLVWTRCLVRFTCTWCSLWKFAWACDLSTNTLHWCTSCLHRVSCDSGRRKTDNLAAFAALVRVKSMLWLMATLWRTRIFRSNGGLLWQGFGCNFLHKNKRLRCLGNTDSNT